MKYPPISTWYLIETLQVGVWAFFPHRLPSCDHTWLVGKSIICSMFPGYLHGWRNFPWKSPCLFFFPICIHIFQKGFPSLPSLMTPKAIRYINENPIIIPLNPMIVPIIINTKLGFIPYRHIKNTINIPPKPVWKGRPTSSPRAPLLHLPLAWHLRWLPRWRCCRAPVEASGKWGRMIMDIPFWCQ